MTQQMFDNLARTIVITVKDIDFFLTYRDIQNFYDFRHLTVKISTEHCNCVGDTPLYPGDPRFNSTPGDSNVLLILIWFYFTTLRVPFILSNGRVIGK